MVVGLAIKRITKRYQGILTTRIEDEKKTRQYAFNAVLTCVKNLEESNSTPMFYWQMIIFGKSITKIWRYPSDSMTFQHPEDDALAVIVVAGKGGDLAKNDFLGAQGILQLPILLLKFVEVSLARLVHKIRCRV
jgi:hypothetical protein